VDPEKEVSLIDKRLEKVEEKLMKISEKVFNGFGKSIETLGERFSKIQSLLAKLLITVFSFGSVGVIISLIFKFLERGGK